MSVMDDNYNLIYVNKITYSKWLISIKQFWCYIKGICDAMLNTSV